MSNCGSCDLYGWYMCPTHRPGDRYAAPIWTSTPLPVATANHTCPMCDRTLTLTAYSGEDLRAIEQNLRALRREHETACGS